jgi:hypothetical protein
MAVVSDDPPDAADQLAAELGSAERVLRVDEWTEDAIRAMDEQRDAWVGQAPVVVVGRPTDLDRFASLAPHVWSWIGPEVWRLDDDAGRFDATERLESFRASTGLTDQQVVARAEAGQLPADPTWAEWLALLGRGDLVGR